MSPDVRPAPGRNGWFWSALFYCAVTCVYFWPLFPDFATRLPSDLGDPALNTWILWWNTQAVPLTSAWWNAPMFLPASDMFALSETLLGLTIITTPLQWAGLSPVATYNLVVVLSYPASALAAHALALRLTGRHDAAFIAGVAFGFNPYRAAHLPHVQLLAAWWLPLSLWWLHRFVDSGRARWVVAAAACWMLAGLTNGYYLVYFAVLLGLWAVWFLRTPKQWLTMTGVFAGAGLAMLPLLLSYKAKQGQFGLARSIDEISSFAADVTSVWAASGRALASRWTAVPLPEGELYPGAVTLLLAVMGVVVVWRAQRPQDAAVWRVRTQRTLVVLASIAALAALSSWWAGGWEWGGISVRRPHRPLTIAIWLAAGAVVLDRRLSEVLSRRSVMAFYLLATVAMLVMALGPFPRFMGERVFHKAPYWWLMQLPGGDALRVPARFGALFVLCLTQLAALAYARMIPRGRLVALAPMLAVAMAVDGWMSEVEFPAVVPPLAAATIPAGANVLELPLNHHHSDTKALLRQLSHGRPLFNGYSGYSPPHYSILFEAVTDSIDADAIRGLQRRGPLAVIVSRNEGVFEQYRDLMNGFPGAVKVSDTEAGIVYTLPERQERTVELGRPLRVRSVSATSRPADVHWMLDQDVRTRWTGLGPQGHDQVVTVELDAPAVVARLELDLGIWHGDYPRGLRVEVLGDDGESATVVFDESTVGEAIIGVAESYASATLQLDLAAAPAARRLRLAITRGHMSAAWTIAELRVFGR